MLLVAHLVYQVLAGLFVAVAAAQFFLAGLGVFGVGRAFGVHATLGLMLFVASVLLLVVAGNLAFGGEMGPHPARRAALLVVLMAVQYSLVKFFSGAAPVLAALHPLNGVLVVGVVLSLALKRRSLGGLSGAVR